MNREINDIIIDVLNGESLSPEEQLFFDTWIKDAGNQRYYHEYLRLRSAVLAAKCAPEENKQRSWERINKTMQRKRLSANLMRYAAVAVLLLSLSIGLVMLNHRQEPTLPLAQEVVTPGKKQAILTLSNGESIRLSDSLISVIGKEQGVEISNSEQNMLVYNKMGTINATAYNTVTVPRGGEYRLILADGSSVWLNSDSRIKYPTSFEGAERKVYLEGEAYFEVAGNQSKPFIVSTPEFDVRVTGTQFNVRVYPDEIESTTLVEGSVQLQRGKAISKLTPGEQMQLINGEMVTRKVNVDDEIAWRGEAFYFKERKLESIMNELARWYDLEIFYQNESVCNYHFSAWFRRSSSIEEVINVLEKTQKIKMQLKGRVLIVQEV